MKNVIKNPKTSRTSQTQNALPLNNLILNGLIREHVPLDDKNWFQTGGDARFFCEPSTLEEYVSVLAWAKEKAVSWVVIGQGANMLISDAGFDGLVIRPIARPITISQISQVPQEVYINNHVFVTASSGVTMSDLIEWCLDNGIRGLEEFSGIPGTIGGSVYINLHYFEFLLAQFVASARVLCCDTGIMHEVTPEWFNFGYNQSRLLEGKHILIDATFKLIPANPLEVSYARGRRVEIIRHRIRRYPSERTCGSFFRNFHADEVDLIVNGKKMIYAAYYLDTAGVRGSVSSGGAAVSFQHANMIVNTGDAITADIITVARTMQERVRERFGIILQPECRLIGFSKYPLLI